MGEQAKGSTARILFDWEPAATPGTQKAEAARNPVVIPIHSSTLKPSQKLTKSTLLRGDRNAAKPTPGNKDASGNLVIPVDMNCMGYFLRALIDKTPTVVEVPQTTNNILVGTNPTVTIAASGAYTFSAAQTACAVGDRVIYLDAAGAQKTAYIKTKTNETTGVLTTDRVSSSTSYPAQITTAALVGILDSEAAATPGTVGIVSGVATFSATHASLAAGNMFIYDSAFPKVAFVSSVLTATTANVVAGNGFAPADAAAKTVEWIGKPSRWKHTFIHRATQGLPTFCIESGVIDISPADYELYKGCKVASMQIAFGGDGELQATVGVVGNGDVGAGATAYDATVPAITVFTEKFSQLDLSATEGGSAVSVLDKFSLSISNNLDTNKYPIGSGGVRRNIPEGDVEVTGSFDAYFEDTTILTKLRNNTTTSLGISVASGGDTLSFTMGEVQLEKTGREISGGGGLSIATNYTAYKQTGTSTVIAELTTLRQSFS